ncbi:hypothetical protein AO398_21115 [Methylobacterium sp. GXS13]|jgi:hypothetical protein|uniref:hypothetical protein n=1 Tax=unclassified Methylobacterium TaxID=2615210 RepID=UPI00071BE940|nr:MULTISPECIES: hypothetical protein [unclassified Methylobacterium]KST58655.1 hypothetical protein AO398_21115 [Methylobacterium sp. GXS13]MCJ2118896.1 hypothetical protein [Methylobacterium sp. J-001]
MKAFLAAVAVGFGVMSALGPALAQRGPDYGYGDRDYGGRDRDDDYRGRDRGYRDRGYGERAYGGFDEREYLRCNPDVRRAIANGQMESGAAHYRTFGRREGRRLSC